MRLSVTVAYMPRKALSQLFEYFSQAKFCFWQISFVPFYPFQRGNYIQVNLVILAQK